MKISKIDGRLSKEYENFMKDIDNDNLLFEKALKL